VGACAAVAIAALAAGCGESKKPKVDAATEQAEAHKRASEGAFGTQVKALDKAKGLGADVNTKVEENVQKVDEAK
jgi:hypothetical protein